MRASTQGGPADDDRAGKMMLQRSPLFRGLPPATFERIAALATQRGYRRGEIVFSPGDPGDALFGVVSGKSASAPATPTGREIFLNIMEPGDTFGEIALLDGGPRTATATAIEAAELVSIRREPFFELLEREPKAALELLRLSGERLRWTSGLLEDAAFLDAPARLAKRLLSLGELHGEDAAAAAGADLAGGARELPRRLAPGGQRAAPGLEGEGLGRPWPRHRRPCAMPRRSGARSAPVEDDDRVFRLRVSRSGGVHECTGPRCPSAMRTAFVPPAGTANVATAIAQPRTRNGGCPDVQVITRGFSRDSVVEPECAACSSVTDVLVLPF